MRPTDDPLFVFLLDQMTRKGPVLIAIGAVVAIFLGCRKDEALPPGGVEGGTPVSPVVLDLGSVPYPTLSQYHFFEGLMADLEPATGVLPYTPITPAFGDYAEKYRFVWMPAGQKASYVADGQALEFPEGAVLIKTAFYPKVLPTMERRILDTRLMIRKGGTWVFAEYVWNEEQTEAYLDMQGSNVPLTWADENGLPHDVAFRIPSEGECIACHSRYDERVPIGPKPQNLNTVRQYPEGPMNQLAKWVAAGYLESGYPAAIETVAAWDDPQESLERRVRAYLDMNCSHCHNEGGFCGYRPMRFSWSESADPAALGVCIPPDDPFAQGVDYIVHAGNANRSMLYYRLSSTEEAVRMPLLERTLRHEEAIQLVADWINSMPEPCP